MLLSLLVLHKFTCGHVDELYTFFSHSLNVILWVTFQWRIPTWPHVSIATSVNRQRLTQRQPTSSQHEIIRGIPHGKAWSQPVWSNRTAWMANLKCDSAANPPVVLMQTLYRHEQQDHQVMWLSCCIPIKWCRRNASNGTTTWHVSCDPHPCDIQKQDWAIAY